MRKLKFDFYIPSLNTCIEYDGEQHDNYIEYFHLSNQEHTDQVHTDSKLISKNAGYVKKGDTVVIVSGVPVGVAGSTNIVKVGKVDWDNF